MKKILIIDEIKDNVILIKTILEELKSDYLVLTTQSGLEGLKRARDDKPDVILMNSVMSEKDGYKVCKKIKDGDSTQHTAGIILIAENLNSDSRIKGFHNGVDAFLSKPINPEELIAQIDVILRNKETIDKLRFERNVLDEIVRKKDDELKISEEILSQIVCSNPVATFAINNEHRIIYWNRACENLTGLSIEEMYQTHDQWRGFYKKQRPVLADIVLGDFIEKEIKNCYHKKYQESSTVENAFEAEDFFPHLGKNGKWLKFTAAPLKDRHGKLLGAIETIMDITEHKQTVQIQKTLYNISNALNTTENMYKFYDRIREFLGDVIDTTNFYVALYDQETDTISLPFDVNEKDHFESFPAGKSLTKYVITTAKPLFVTDNAVGELAKKGIIDKIGAPSEIWLGVPLKIENHVIGIIAVQGYDDPHLYSEKDIEILTFVSEEIAVVIKRKQAEEQIMKELKENKILLREIHHRVKNNLQVISGLLQLQAVEIHTKEDALSGFAASQDRIQAMAKAYGLLLGSKYLSEVSVSNYIESLAEQLKHNYDIHNKVNISYSMDEVTIGIEILDRLGLILNEIITNSIKYAFDRRDSGNVYIDLKEMEEHIEIKISDDGIGIPKEIDIKNPESLGLSIVEMLMTQLHGTYSWNVRNGTSIILSIQKKINYSK